MNLEANFIFGYSPSLKLDFIEDLVDSLVEKGVELKNIDIITPYKTPIDSSVFKKSGKGRILIVHLDELYQLYRIPQDYDIVLHTLGSIRYQNIYPIHLGYAFRYDNKGEIERTLTSNFIGWSRNREQFAKFAETLESPDHLIRLNDKWGTGLSSEEYYEVLRKSKLTLAPTGALAMSYREIEAIKFGSLPVVEMKYYRNIFRDLPHYRINSWCEKELSKALDYYHSLNNPTKLIVDYYEEMLSPNALSDKIIELL